MSNPFLSCWTMGFNMLKTFQAIVNLYDKIRIEPTEYVYVIKCNLLIWFMK